MKFDIIAKIISIVAKRGSGKSELVKHILRLYNNLFIAVFLISPTEFTDAYKGLIPDNRIYTEYNEEWVMRLIHKMEQENKQKSKEEKKNILLILDDCLSDITMRSSKIKSLKILASRGRHMSISVIITAQSLKQLSPIFRQNTDYLICGKMIRSDIENVEKEFRSNMSKNEFIEMLEENTNNYGFVIINNTTNKDDDNYGLIRLDR